MPLIRAYQARDSMEAQFVSDLLRARGIPAVVMGDSLEGLVGAIPARAALPVVWVPEQHAGSAAELVAEFKQRPLHAPEHLPAWRCPSCGELHDEQFSDCWACGTPRPDADPAEASRSPAKPEPNPQQDVFCLRCSYNLRGLPLNHPCPECGFPVIGSVLDFLAQGTAGGEGGDNALEPLIRDHFQPVTQRLGFPITALILVSHGWLLTLLNPATEAAVQIDPAGMCLAVRDHAIRYFGDSDEARTTFSRWGILGSEEIGKIAAGLAAAGIIPSTPSIDPAAFGRLFTLDDLFPFGDLGESR